MGDTLENEDAKISVRLVGKQRSESEYLHKVRYDSTKAETAKLKVGFCDQLALATCNLAASARAYL